jgi:phage terminase large subunit-like protein
VGGTSEGRGCFAGPQGGPDLLSGHLQRADNADWTKEILWKKVNPSLGITVDIEKLRVAFENARQNPARKTYSGSSA